MISPWKGRNPIYFSVIWIKDKVTVTMNTIFHNRVVSAWYIWFCILDLHQARPLDCHLKGEESCLFWDHWVKGQGHCYYSYNDWQHGRFRTIALVVYIGYLSNLATLFPCGRGRTLFILGSLGERSKVKVTITINIFFDKRVVFRSVYWISTKFDNMILLCKGNNLIYVGVIMSKVKVTITINIFVDNCYYTYNF